MRAFIILCLAGLAMAALPISTENITLTPEQIHGNIMRTMPADRIVTSGVLTDYLKENLGTNHTIYVSDDRRLINMASVTVDPQATVLDDDGRGPPPFCFNFQKHWAQQTQQFWKPWVPISGCRENELNPAAASFSINWGHTLSIEENAGLSWSVIKDALSVAAGISVTETWSHGGAFTCNVPGHSIGQMWLQNKVVWGWMWAQNCNNCRVGLCNSGGPVGGATAPYASTEGGIGVNLGCSTGRANVKCD